MKSKFLLIFIIFILVILSLVAFKTFKNQNYIIKINEEKISKEEFLTYLFEQKKVFEAKGGTDIWDTDFNGISAIEVAKQNALNSITLVKTAVLNADKLGIFLTPEEEQNIKSQSEALILEVNESLDITLSLEIATKITRETKIEQKVFDYITYNFILSETDFKTYFDNYLNENKKDLTTVTANITFIKKSLENTQALALEIYNLIKNNPTYEISKEKYPEIETFKNVVLNQMYFEETIEDQIYTLEENEIKLLETSNGYYIFNILSIEFSNLKDIEETLRENYTLLKKQEIYSNQTETWAKEITVTKNQEIWDEITTI